jgi:hypothetical protein
MKIRRGKPSGTLGESVSVDSKYGQVVRSRPRRWRGDTEARVRARDAVTRFARLWRTLTEAQRAGWRALARQVKCRASEGAGARLHGCQLFVKINCALAAAGLLPVMDAPKRVKFGPNPVKRLRITRREGKVRLELELAARPVGHVLVLGSRPCSAGISVRSTYSIIGLLPGLVRGWGDITELYVKRFGVPPAGTRVFIRTRQIIGGWEDEFKDVDALVPEGK